MDSPNNSDKYIIVSLIAYSTVALFHILNGIATHEKLVISGCIFAAVLSCSCAYYMIISAYSEEVISEFWPAEKLLLISVFGSFFGTFTLLLAYNGIIGSVFLIFSVSGAFLFAYLKKIKSRIID